jgi:hypothetical protein
METERVSEKSEVFKQLTRLSAREDFIQFSRRESLNTYSLIVFFLKTMIVRTLSPLHMLCLFAPVCIHEFDFVEERCKRFLFAFYRLVRNLGSTCRANLVRCKICFVFTVNIVKDY